MADWTVATSTPRAVASCWAAVAGVGVAEGAADEEAPSEALGVAGADGLVEADGVYEMVAGPPPRGAKSAAAGMVALATMVPPDAFRSMETRSPASLP
ncbi:MAG TPA: hypothetical protein VF375_10630, partial [Candidatus Limnocylindrales bacterium]